MKHLLLERVAYALLLKSYSAGEAGMWMGARLDWM